MSITPAPTLPPEIWRVIFHSINIRDLSAVSLASHNWQALAFPDLYHTVCLGRAPDLEQLAKRIVANDSQLPVREHLRGLVVVDQGPNRKYSGKAYSVGGEHDLATLTTLLSAAPHLEHFAWELPFFILIQNITETLRSRCLSLRSVHFLIEDSNCFWSEPYIQILAFTNLKHLSLKVTSLPSDFNEDHAKPLASLIRSCPEIQSINIDLKDFPYSGGHWSLGILCSHFQDDTFRQLNTFRAFGETDTDSFLHTTEDNSLRQFFLRHPNLHKVGLGWVPDAEYTRVVPSTLMESLFPSIRHVEVPGFLCARIITSELAVQIESMKIVNRYWNDPPGPNLGTVFYSGKRMLNLRRLTFCRELPHPDGSDWLEGILLLAPKLEVLELGRVFTKLDDVIGPLGAAPKLQIMNYFFTSADTVPHLPGERRSGWIVCVSEDGRVFIRRERSQT